MSNTKKLNTKDIKTSGEQGTPKSLQPGNVVCTIHNVKLRDFRFKPNAYEMVLTLEGPDQGPDFEGFFIDKNDESLGRYKGQVADVKAGEWAFSDGVTKSGIEISRDEDILKFMKNLCVSLDINNWLVSQDDKHDTIESLVEKFNEDKPFKGIAMEYCIAGKEYTNKNNYTAYDLFLPKFSKEGSPFGKTRVAKFNPDTHIRRKKVEPVNEFGSDDAIPGAASADFQLD